MFNRKTLLPAILISIIFIQTAPAVTVISGQQNLSAGYLNPALVGISALRVVIIYDNTELGTGAGLLSDLGARVEQRLIGADYRLAVLIQNGFNARYLDTPILRININTFLLTADRPPVFLIQTSFAADIRMPRNINSLVKVDLWTRADTIQTKPGNSDYDTIGGVIQKHTDLFANDFILANNLFNPPTIADVNTPTTSYQSVYPSTTLKDYNDPNKAGISKYKQADKPQAGYVGSKGSRIFHKPDCPLAKKILPKNLITYTTRQQAIDADKKPCKYCNP
jgi:hypothetical protein